MLSIQKRKGLLIDILAFLVHLTVSLGFAALAFLIQAPLFGIQPEPYAIFQSALFFLFAAVIFIANLFLIGRGTFSMYVAVVGLSLLTAIIWSVWISGTDMIFFIFGYLIIAAPILGIKYQMS